MADIKTLYFNEPMLEKLICLFGGNLKVKKSPSYRNLLCFR